MTAENSDVQAALSKIEGEAASPAAGISQDKVTEIVRDAFNRGRQKGLSESSIGMGGMSAQPVQHAPIDQQAVSKLIGDEFSKHKAEYERTQLEQAQRVEGERQLRMLKTKVDAAAAKHPDYDEVTKQHNWEQMPEVLHYANTVDNAGDVLYDLAKNPSKIATIRGLPPASAALEIKKLSDSIKQNETASIDATKPPPVPGSQLKPSNLASDKQPSTASEYAARYKGRG
jgi:hypothetical protein